MESVEAVRNTATLDLPVRLYGVGILLIATLLGYFLLYAPLTTAHAGGEVMFIGLRGFVPLGVALLYGPLMLLAGPPFLRLRARLFRIVGGFSILDLVLLLIAVALGMLLEHWLKLELIALGYPLYSSW